MPRRTGPAALLLLCFAALGLPGADAKPTPPDAAGAAPVVLPPQSIAEVVSARIRIPTGALAPVAALSSKIELAGLVGADANHLSRPIVLSLAHPMVGSSRYELWDPSRTVPESGEASFTNRYDVDRGWAGGVIVTLDVMAGRTYVVECVGSPGDWEVSIYGKGTEYYEERTRTTLSATARPSTVIAADDNTTMKVLVAPRIPLGEARTMGRCQLSRVTPVK